MKKYNLILGGRGAEIFIHNITPEQKEKLKEMDIENKDVSVDWDKLNEVLGHDWDSSDDMFTGAYDNPTAYHIRVFDENENEVFASDNDFFMEEGNSDEDYQFVEKENVFVAEHYVKGTFKEYQIEIEGEFDPLKVTPVVVEINEAISVVTDLKYDGKVLENFEWGDDWSKGAFFYIF